MTGTLGRHDSPTLRETATGTGVRAWLGLRYACTNRRFSLPQPAGGRLEVQRLAEVPVFPQSPGRLAAFMGTGRDNPQSENAHFLNVWAPEDADRLPVMVFIHGGAWMTGGGAQEWYDGARLAARGIVVVTVNYRLGALGHLGDQSRIGLPLPAEDLIMALQWVQEQIHRFGGDPGHITLVGQSAGGWYGHLLSVLPGTRGMIHQVAHLSMGTRAPWSQLHQQHVHQLATEAVGPQDPAEAPLSLLLSAGAQALQASRQTQTRPPLSHAPAGYLPVQTPGLPETLLDPDWAASAVHARAVFLRWTAEESAAFFWNSPQHLQATQDQVDADLGTWAVQDLPDRLVQGGRFTGADSGLSPYRQLVDASSWSQFQRFPSEFAQSLQAACVTTVVDPFVHASPLPHLHSAHCFDLPFQFGNAAAWQDAPMLRGVTEEEFERISEDTMGALVAFISQQH
ncbi:carboxylesterase family protein [Arthrobacter mangrovi]|uniref:Carboxylic ester hydrolase n=1 Tax=Arthrobacter mangrovi TaxID=2966350 RepID=A0ABQ5MYV8_9MICC|nr:carboxylesterase family protein [Arthrobacter mangrovi]GLB69128.1 hypothetical protein AHIS1636_35710 [Arthrobacter mangrovi]